MTVEYLYDIISLRYILAYLMLYDLTFVVRIENLTLHHTVANGCHLWTMFWVHDGSDDRTSECWTNLHQLLLVVLVDEIITFLHLHVEVVNLELSTVGCQT